MTTNETTAKAMTAKEAIRARCIDCTGVDHGQWRSDKCIDKDCALYGLAGAVGEVGVGRPLAIKKYCAWCMHGEPVHSCSCIKCAIRQYRAQPTVTARIAFEA
ncbi:MAG: hypothetical protein Ta2A_12000 [Treponemataceae bacterium]|nr:MAG: hypothetical protein Ta2A_12000 [Treponemataceae bacterium]